MDIYSLIKADHRKVKVLLKKLTQNDDSPSGTRRERLLQTIKMELEPHNKAEERVFYSQLKATRKSRVLSIEGKSEHDIGGELLKDLETLDGASDAFAAKAKVLRELVEHHIQEEEGEVHKQARKELSPQDAVVIGRIFTSLKKEIKAELKSGAPKKSPETNTASDEKPAGQPTVSLKEQAEEATGLFH